MFQTIALYFCIPHCYKDFLIMYFTLKNYACLDFKILLLWLFNFYLFFFLFLIIVDNEYKIVGDIILMYIKHISKSILVSTNEMKGAYFCMYIKIRMIFKSSFHLKPCVKDFMIYCLKWQLTKMAWLQQKLILITTLVSLRYLAFFVAVFFPALFVLKLI